MTDTPRIAAIKESLVTKFYYEKWFQLGLPSRRFVQVNLETNSVCNRKCHFCLFGITEVPRIRMSSNLFFNIIDQLSELRFKGRLSLFEINEPLTDKRIFDFTKYATLMLPNCYQAMVSNGDLLSKDKLERLFECGLDLLVINSYDEDAKRRNGELYGYATNLYPGKIMHTDKTAFTAWDSRAGHIKQYAKTPAGGFCDYPNHILYIKPDGKVLSCWHDFDGQNLMGDLTNKSITEVWFGPKFKAFRKQINRGNRNVSSLCATCDHKPDFEYIKWNASLARVHGKSTRFVYTEPQPNDITEAAAIKAKYLEKDSVRLSRQQSGAKNAP
jgi:radical SAM protein with 4Fe4S-binding SPASM domain